MHGLWEIINHGCAPHALDFTFAIGDMLRIVTPMAPRGSVLSYRFRAGWKTPRESRLCKLLELLFSVGVTVETHHIRC